MTDRNKLTPGIGAGKWASPESLQHTGGVLRLCAGTVQGVLASYATNPVLYRASICVCLFTFCCGACD